MILTLPSQKSQLNSLTPFLKTVRRKNYSYISLDLKNCINLISATDVTFSFPEVTTDYEYLDFTDSSSTEGKQESFEEQFVFAYLIVLKL